MDQKGQESKANEGLLGEFILLVFMSMRRTKGSLEAGCAKLPTDSRKKGEAVDMEGISRRLRGLAPMQEKVLRLYFGLGCERTHTAREMAEEFGVSAQVIAGILGAAQRRLAAEGLSVSDLREAARRAGEASATKSPVEPSRRHRSGTHWHNRSPVR
jgi:hypothetical protein